MDLLSQVLVVKGNHFLDGRVPNALMGQNLSSLFSGMKPESFINILVIFGQFINVFYDVQSFIPCIEFQLEQFIFHFLHIFWSSLCKLKSNVHLYLMLQGFCWIIEN